MEPKLDIGKKIFKRRESLKISQSELGRMIGAARATVCNWEAGRNPELNMLPVLAKALETSVSFLMGETEDPAPAPQWRREGNQQALQSLDRALDFLALTAIRFKRSCIIFSKSIDRHPQGCYIEFTGSKARNERRQEDEKNDLRSRPDRQQLR